MNSKYENISDEELIEKIRLGDSQAQNYLMEKYKNLVNNCNDLLSNPKVFSKSADIYIKTTDKGKDNRIC